MNWSQVAFMTLGNAGIWIPMLIWLKGSQEDDRKELAAKQDSNRKELAAKQEADRKELMEVLREIKEENKSFHGRLCAIEERRK